MDRILFWTFIGILKTLIVLMSIIPSQSAPTREEIIYKVIGCLADQDVMFAHKHLSTNQSEELVYNRTKGHSEIMKPFVIETKVVSEFFCTGYIQDWKLKTFQGMEQRYDSSVLMEESLKQSPWFEECVRCWDTPVIKKEITILLAMHRGLSYFVKTLNSLLRVEEPKSWTHSVTNRTEALLKIRAKIESLKWGNEYALGNYIINIPKYETSADTPVEMEVNLNPQSGNEVTLQDMKFLHQIEKFIRDWEFSLCTLHRKNKRSRCEGQKVEKRKGKNRCRRTRRLF